VIAILGLVLIMRWKVPGLAIVAFSGLIGLLLYR
jgi:hypothetical protein